MKKSIILSSAVFLGVLIAARPAAASILPECAESGRCTLCDILQVVINLGIFLFGIVGALVLLYFFYAGFLLLTSAGESGKVKKGKDMMVNAVIGFIIVFGAYTGVNFMINAVTGGSWNWESNLKCAQLPEQTGWKAPPTNQGAGPGSPTAIGTATQPDGSTGTETPSGEPKPTGKQIECSVQVDTNKDCTDNTPCGTCGYCTSTKKCAWKKKDGDVCSNTEPISKNGNDVCHSNKCVGYGTAWTCVGQCSMGGGAQGQFSTGCNTATQYCQNLGDVTTKCVPKVGEGASCKPDLIKGAEAYSSNYICQPTLYCLNVEYTCAKKGAKDSPCEGTAYQKTEAACPNHGPAGDGSTDYKASANYTCISGTCILPTGNPCGKCQ